MERVDGQAAASAAAEADLLRATVRAQWRDLVAKDMQAADRVYADDFQLIAAPGGTLGKAEYLGGIASGRFDYRVWEPDSPIAVRLYCDGAAVRYRSRFEIVVSGRLIPLGNYWHMDVYERRDGRWQVVWSQATPVRS